MSRCRAFPILSISGKECVQHSSFRGGQIKELITSQDGTYSNWYCLGFSPNSLFTAPDAQVVHGSVCNAKIVINFDTTTPSPIFFTSIDYDETKIPSCNYAIIYTSANVLSPFVGEENRIKRGTLKVAGRVSVLNKSTKDSDCYPLCFEPKAGLEPATFSLRVKRSTT